MNHTPHKNSKTPNSIKQIHRYNESRFAWDATYDPNCNLFNNTLPAPYVPVVKSATDMGNFRAHEADLPPEVTYKPIPGDNWDADF